MDLNVDLAGKVAVVTAAGGTIGSAIARALAKNGAALALNDVNAEGLEAICAELGALALPGDAGDFAAVQRLAGRAVERLGAPFVLVNVAGAGQVKHVVDLSEAEFDAVLTLNLKSAFNWCHALLPHMLRGAGGRIVNTSSVSGKKGGDRNSYSRAAYAAAKAGILGLTRGLALEVAPKVTVNAICPGMVPNPRTRGVIAARGQALMDDYILGRLGTGDDIAKAVLYFIAADWVTGEVTDVNGGYYID